jgi:hypothetical protein
LEKIAQLCKKVAKIITEPTYAKISTPKLNLKVQNIYIRPLLKPATNHAYYNIATITAVKSFTVQAPGYMY